MISAVGRKLRNVFLYLSLSIMFLFLHMAILIIGNTLIGKFINPLENVILTATLNGIFNIVVILLIMKGMGFKKKDIIKKDDFKIDILDLIIIAMIYYCFVIVVDIIRTNIEMTFFKDLYVNYTKKIEQSITNPQYDIWINSSIVVILVDLILAIMEELYFRVFIHKTLIKRNFSKFSVIMISAMAFGIRHWFFTPFSVIAIVFGGVLLSFVMFATDNIIYPIFLHGGLRMINVLIIRCFNTDYLKDMQNPYGNGMEIIIIFVVLFIFCLASYLIRRRIFSEKMKEGIKGLFIHT